MADAGHVAWDMERFQFLDQQEEFDSIHPSLHRQSVLNNNYGLYEVIPGIYQVRGFDLVRHHLRPGQDRLDRVRPAGDRGDGAGGLEAVPGACRRGPAGLGGDLLAHARRPLGRRARHRRRGRRAVRARSRSSRPSTSWSITISENVYAGNAMNRRLFYQYGLLLPASPHGYVGQGLGQAVSAGAVGLIAPNRFVEKDIEEIEVDGVRMVFQNTPNTEAPREMNTYIPEMKALWMAENVIASLHNIYTLRGAPVRDPLNWSKYISEALYRFGLEAEVMFASHHWPRWGNERIQEVLRGQRDLYANMNNQVLHLANQGVTINEIHNVYEVPKGLQEQVVLPRLSRLAAAQQPRRDPALSRVLGLQPGDAHPAVAERIRAALCRDDGRRRRRSWPAAGSCTTRASTCCAQEIVNKLVQAEPQNQAAKDLLADIFEQIGYQQENPGLRNSFLAAAYELRTGIPQGETANSSSPDVIRAMSTELFLNFLGIRMDSRKAEGMRFTINLVTPDNGEKFLVELENATLTNIKGFQADKPDLTLTINRSDLEQTMMGAKTLEAQIADGTAKVEGDAGILKQLASTMVDFDPRFEIMPGTKAPGREVAHAAE